MKINNLKTFEKEQLLRFFLHHLTPDLRGQIIEEYPVVYRKLLGREDSATFREGVRKAVLKDEPRLCACGQLYTTEEQHKECVENEYQRFLEAAKQVEQEMDPG